MSRITLGIFIGEHAAHSRHHGLGNDVFRGDQFQVAALAAQLQFHNSGNFRIIIFDKINVLLYHG